MRILLFFVYILLGTSLSAQDLYKTPSGDKYHLESCRMVNNVSEKVSLKDAAEEYGLTACKICRPPKASQYGYQTLTITSYNKAQGTDENNQCLGITKAGSQCKHSTSIGNDYCFQHSPDISRQNSRSSSSYKSTYRSSSSTNTPRCGARTKSGSACKRKVKGGGRCYQHK